LETRIMTANPPEDTVTAQLGRAFRLARPHGVISAYLFGSHAEGRVHRESDVDIAVLLSRSVFPSGEARFGERVRMSAWLAGELHRNAVDVVVLNDAPPHFARRICTAGLRIFCADAADDHVFRRDAQLRAADLEPFLRRMRRLKLAALTR
jgi:predicted nucleotidyltransferase